MITWDDVTDFYRKTPARFKAVQYEKDVELPPFKNLFHNEIVLDEGDWIVLDIETDKTFILKESIFSLVFEKVN